MLLHDRIYGDSEIDSSVLIELVGSPSVQRLKGINQLGVPECFYFIKGFSRYEHSVGVMLLLKRMGASEEEQVAGLLHDVSHTAFSHVIDFVVKEIGGEESYQDDNHLSFLLQSELPKILEKHGFTTQVIADHHRFGLLEQPMPEVCADRIDYALREFPDEAVKKTLDGLMVLDKRIVFKEVTAAKIYAENYIKRQKQNWGGLEAVNRYIYFGKALRRALGVGAIEFADFLKDDEAVLKKLGACKDPEYLRITGRLRMRSWADLPKTGEMVPKKKRYVDPLCLVRDELKHLSEADEEYRNELEASLEEQSKGVPLVSID